MIQLYIISVFVLVGIIVAHNIFGGLIYKTKSFSRSLFSNYSFKSEFKEIPNKKDFLKSSSSITVKLIYSGDLKTHLSTAINLKHPSCSGLKDKEISVPIFAYLISHEKFGYFLIDSGCGSSYINNPYGKMKVSLISKFIPKTILKPEDAIDKQIENYRNEIKGVFFTHLHLDHTSGLSALPDNLLYFSGKGEKPLLIKWLLEPNDFKNNDIMYILDFDSTQAQSTPLGKAIDIFGDQSFWAISTPGHTKGHISYLVNTKEHPILIAGDACCISLSIEKGVGPSGSDTTLGQKSFENMMQFLKDNQEVKLWIGHEFPK
ncbi:MULTISPECIES: MBL fold metallo-hydrolase [unclassified Clostridium]|uniref:MBL fold metallo-hydrolase n=1 Tax=unclassified Clostridium TaxID=2614128 RepID=UPI0002978828|nr:MULTISPECIES: MBL fold metallo-hydrolase [unclassified Clostridium]EKQ53387.1 MAG: Zn-dependent hydrolase, glyoxylase [Clostridium sp. Maddingley MBC34-26]